MMNEVKSIYDQEMRRRRLQEALLQQPQGTQYTGGPYSRAVPYSVGQGLAGIGQALAVRYGREKGEQRIEDAIKAQEDKRKRLAEAVIKTYQGTPAVPEQPYQLSPEEQFGEEQIPGLKTAAVPGIPGDPTTAMLQAASVPETEKMATVLAALEKAKSSRGAYSTPIKMFNPETGKEEWYSFDTRAPAGAPRISPLNVPGVETPTSPSAKRAKEKQKKLGEHEAKREFNMAGLGQTIDEARSLLETGKPTGSGFGAAIDWIGRQAGITSESAQMAAQLEAVGGALTSKMPRMEGPQSDRDTELYRQMAAKVGDRTVPREERLEALKVVDQLWRKYDPGAAKTPVPQKPEDVPKELWDVMTPEEKALWP